MINVVDVRLQFGGQLLFDEVNVKFTQGNCYGLIGANGAGKSTFMKILSGDIEPNKGEVIVEPNKRISTLKQDQFAFDAFTVLQTVLMGHKPLCAIMEERDALYAKADFTDEDGLRAGELEDLFAQMDGYNAESAASILLSQLEFPESLHHSLMSELEPSQKIKVLLAQALFGNPDILLLDEPTNHLDHASIVWLEDFLLNFQNTVIVISHDRHFLNTVCTHIADLDYKKLRIFVGNYDFWYQSSQLIMSQKRDTNKKNEDRIKELEEFVRRFSANASKSKQATSRKKLIEKLKPEELPVSSRKSPFIGFKAQRPCGDIILDVVGLNATVEGVPLLKNIHLEIRPGDKIAFVGSNNLAITTFFDLISGKIQPDSGKITWGSTITFDYMPTDNSEFFKSSLPLLDWLRQFTTSNDEHYLRGFLGRMLFSGEECFKKVSVLSGGEKARCMFSKLMLAEPNVLIMDEPTNHLDLESISALNEGMAQFKEVILFSSHDHQLVQSVANRIVEFHADGSMTAKLCTFEEYLASKSVNK